MKIKTVALNKAAKGATTLTANVIPTQTVQPPPPVVKTVAQEIWEEIRGLAIEMFALPNQTVENHCVPVQVDPSKLFLTIRSSATLPALEECLKQHSDHLALIEKKRKTGLPTNKFTVELADKFVIVTRSKS